MSDVTEQPASLSNKDVSHHTIVTNNKELRKMVKTRGYQKDIMSTWSGSAKGDALLTVIELTGSAILKT